MKDVDEIIDAFGGTCAVAALFEITSGAVSQWRAKGAIPRDKLKILQLMRPDLFERRAAAAVKVGAHA